jgi:U3 small nucleolar RNA-associated protein 7
VASGAARKAFELRLPNLGPYTLDFSRSGRYLLLAGRLGHLAMIDWHKHSLITEIQV